QRELERFGQGFGRTRAWQKLRQTRIVESDWINMKFTEEQVKCIAECSTEFLAHCLVDSRLPNLLNCREQLPDQDRDDSENRQQFDQRETQLAAAPRTSRGAVAVSR